MQGTLFQVQNFTVGIHGQMDLAGLSKLANDNGVMGMYPITQLKITKHELGMPDLAILRVGWEMPMFVTRMLEETVLPASGRPMVPIKRWRTWAEIEEINVAIKAKLEALLQSDGYHLPAGMTLRELKGSNVPAHKRLFKKIKKGMKAWCVKQAHCFKLPVQYMLMLMRNCPMHADQNMSKQLLVLALKTAFEIDCWNGNAKPLKDNESATTLMG